MISSLGKPLRLGLCGLYAVSALVFLQDVVGRFLDWSAATKELQAGPSYAGEPEELVAELLSNSGSTRRGEVPEDFQSRVERIDPDNGWYDCWRAFTIGKAAYEKESSRSTWRSKRKKPANYFITNEENFELAYRAIQEALKKPKLTNYFPERTRASLREGETPEDFISQQMIRAKLLSGYGDVLVMKTCAEILVTKLHDLAVSPDREAFAVAEKTCLRFCDKQFSNSHSLIDLLIAQSTFSEIYRGLAKAAVAHEQVEAAERYDKKFESFSERRDEIKERKKRNPRSEDEVVLGLHASRMAYIMQPVTESLLLDRPKFSSDDLKPERRAEHAFVGGIFFAVFFPFLSVAALVCFVIARRGSNEEREENQKWLRKNMSTRDWLMLFFRAVISPLILVLGIRYATPWGGLKYGPYFTQYATHGLPFVALLLLWIIWSLIAARRFVDPGWSGSWKALFFALLPLVAIVLGGLYCCVSEELMTSNILQYAAVGSLLGCMLYLAVIWFSSWTDDEVRRKKRSLVAALLMPCALLGASVTGFGVALFHLEERYWTKRNHFGNPADVIVSGYEAKVIEQLRREIEVIVRK